MNCAYCGNSIKDNERRVYFRTKECFLTRARVDAFCHICSKKPGVKTANIITESEYLLRSVMEL